MTKSKILGPKWPRKLKREAFERSLFVQALRAEYEANMQSWLDGLRMHCYWPDMP